MPAQNPTDDVLIEHLRKGDAGAFKAIYVRYWRPLYGFVYQQLGSKEDAEEILHDLFLSLWQNRDKVHIQQLSVYLFVAVRNLTNKFIKSKINLRKYREYQLLHRIVESTQPEEIGNPEDLLQAVERVMQHMPEKTARIFRLSKMEEMPVKKIAATLNLTEKAVEYHITKSLQMLRQQLQRFQSHN